jgi:hypothetical protein
MWRTDLFVAEGVEIIQCWNLSSIIECSRTRDKRVATARLAQRESESVLFTA